MTTLQCLLGIGIIMLIVAFIIAIRIYRKSTKNDIVQKNSFNFAIILGVIGFLLSFISSLFLLTIDVDRPVTTSATEPSEVSTVESSSRITTTESTTNETSSNTTTTKPTEPIVDETITNNTLPFTFTMEDQKIRASFKTEIEGKYRFDFEIDNTDYDYKFELFDSQNTVLIESSYNSYEHGDSYRLEKDKEYIIIVTQTQGLTSGKIKIGVPPSEKVINLQ